MTRVVPVAVVGGGAAGLMAAISAATHGAETILLESTQRVGTKILMSGGTRCNVTHDFVEAADYFGGSRNVVARLLREFSHEDARRFFEETLGVPLKREETGKLFPVSDSAQDVVDALVARAREVGVEIRTGHRLIALERAAVDCFELTFDAGVPPLSARRVVLTTGGLSFPRTGSDGTGYALAAALGHTIEATTPALTPLVSSGGIHERLRGVTLEVELTVRVAGKRAWRGAGSFLFTHFGYSGPVVLDASRHVARAPAGAEVAVVASFLPGVAAEAFDRALLEEARSEPRRTVLGALRSRLPESVARELLDGAGLVPDQLLSQLLREERRALVETVTAFPLPVNEVMGYRKAEVTAGGVELSEVNPSTMQSRRAPGLYLAGEILNVDGRLGGYNFQWAWSTGWVAGRGAARGGVSHDREGEDPREKRS